MIVRAYHLKHGLNAVISNCTNNCGWYQFLEKLIPVFIRNCLALKSILVYGDGMNVRNGLYVHDHAEPLWQKLTRDKYGETYNVDGPTNEPTSAS